MNAAIHPNKLIQSIGDAIVEYYQSTGLMEYVICFYDEFLPSELEQWMRQVYNFINVYVRRQTQGELFGIYRFEAVDETLRCHLCKNTCPYFGLNLFPSRPEQDVLIDHISRIVSDNYRNDEFFTEVLYDPAAVSQQQIQQLLKEMSRCYSLLQALAPGARFTTVRKLNSLQQFSFIILVFDLSNINAFISGQFRFRQPSRFPLKVNGALRAQYEYKTLFTQLLTNATIDDLSYYIVERVSSMEQRVEIPAALRILDDFVPIYSQILSLQFHAVMRNRQIVVSRSVDRVVAEVRVVPMTPEAQKKVEALLEYISNLSGPQYKQVILGLYHTGDISVAHVRSASRADAGPAEDDALHADAEEASDFVCAVVDAALQQYMFESAQHVDVDLAGFDETQLKQSIALVRRALEAKLSQGDSVECGVTLDGEVFLRLHKASAAAEGKRRRRKKRTKRTDAAQSAQPVLDVFNDFE